MKTAIVGLGLIGSSLAYQLKEAGCSVIGYARKQETVDKALTLGIIDSGSTNLETVVAEVDIVVLAIPIEIIPIMIKEVDEYVSNGTVVVDVGSVKKYIMDQVSGMSLQNALFVGAHPMAGSEKVGIDNFVRDLYIDKPFIVTYPDESIKKKTQKLIKEFVKIIKSKYIEMDEDTHDKMVSDISHIPYILSSVLYNQVARGNSEKVASSGYRDMTRIAHSDPLWGTVVSFLNKDNICNGIDEMIAALNFVKKSISKGDIDTIFDYLNIDNKDNTKKNLVKKQINDYYGLE